MGELHCQEHRKTTILVTQGAVLILQGRVIVRIKLDKPVTSMVKYPDFAKWLI